MCSPIGGEHQLRWVETLGKGSPGLPNIRGGNPFEGLSFAMGSSPPLEVVVRIDEVVLRILVDLSKRPIRNIEVLSHLGLRDQISGPCLWLMGHICAA